LGDVHNSHTTPWHDHTSSPEAPAPTNTNAANEDDVKFLDIKQILKEAKVISRPLIFSGTDYGIITMSTSVPTTLIPFYE
jgi:hypothetical protein